MSTTATATSAKREIYLARRKWLIDTSNMLKKGGDEDSTVNDMLREMYEEEGHTELNTLHQWNELGYKVRKGEHALLVWGSPRQSQQGDDDEDASTKYWPICYLFSQLQVEKR